MPQLTYEKEITGLVVIDPYNDFISEGGKIWDRIKNVAEGNQVEEPRAEVGRDDGGSQRQGYWRWVADLLSGCPRRFTSLWIGTTTKVRLAVVPLSLLKSAKHPPL